MQRTNVYAGVKGQILQGFSNMPQILQAYPHGGEGGILLPPLPASDRDPYPYTDVTIPKRTPVYGSSFYRFLNFF